MLFGERCGRTAILGRRSPGHLQSMGRDSRASGPSGIACQRMERAGLLPSIFFEKMFHEIRLLQPETIHEVIR